MSVFVSEKSKEILFWFNMAVRHNVWGSLDKYTLNELRVALQELSPSSYNAPELKAIEDRIEELEVKRRKALHASDILVTKEPSVDKPLQKPTRRQKLTKKQKSNLSDDMSKIDKYTWKLPPEETFIFRKTRKDKDPETILSPKQNEFDNMETFLDQKPVKVKVGDYKFYVVWNGSGSKGLDIRKSSHMDSLFTLFIVSKENDYVVSQKHIRKYLNTKQPSNRVVRDVNDALVDKLRWKFPKEKEHIPDLIIGYSKKKDGYITLIPIVDESDLDTLDKEEHILEEPIKEFLEGVKVRNRGGKKM